MGEGIEGKTDNGKGEKQIPFGDDKQRGICETTEGYLLPKVGPK
jgi:hypothetical protein